MPSPPPARKAAGVFPSAMAPTFVRPFTSAAEHASQSDTDSDSGNEEDGLEMCCANLKSRGVLHIRGPDSRKFLQGLTTNDLERLALTLPPLDDNDMSVEAAEGSERNERAMFTAFLNPKGRIVTDGIVINGESNLTHGMEPSFYIDVDKDNLPRLLKYFTMYRLRSDLTIEDVSDTRHVWSIMPAPEYHTLLENSSSEPSNLDGDGDDDTTTTFIRLAASSAASAVPDDGDPNIPSDGGVIGRENITGDVVLFDDPRLPALGMRAILPASFTSPEEEDSSSSSAGGGLLSFPRVDEHVYTTLRHRLGVPEGGECVGAIPNECNFDVLNGISFDKGCYIGQELVARTHFKGVVRKRIVPVRWGKPASEMDSSSPESSSSSSSSNENDSDTIKVPVPGTKIHADGVKRAAGKVVASAPGEHMGLARLRLQYAPAFDFPPGAAAAATAAANNIPSNVENQQNPKLLVSSGDDETIDVLSYAPPWWESLLSVSSTTAEE